MNIDNIKVTVNNTKSVSLKDLTTSLSSFNAQYLSLLDKKGVSYNKKQPTLLVQEVKKGSIIVDMVSALPSVLPILNTDSSIKMFFDYLKYTFDYFKVGNFDEKPQYEYTPKDCTDIKEIQSVLVNDNGSTLNIQTRSNNSPIILNFSDANTIQSNSI